jgi:hypothetical protein
MQLDDRFTPGHVACSDAIASDIREAIAAFNVYAPKAAVVMIRRALEGACSEKGARGKKLSEKIKDLHERAGYFDDAHVAIATGTRLFGNLSAHPGHDLLEDISDDEARRALDLGLYLIKKMCSPRDDNS